MKIIGLAGGIAGGKSLVATQLEALGARRIDADSIGHQVLEEPQIKEAIRDSWGSGVFDSGKVDRAALALRVFAPPPDGPAALARLEELTHPLIGERIQARIREARAEGLPALILDAPVMFKAGWDRFCDVILFVDADRDSRLSRARARGWTEQQFSAREAAQEAVEEKRRKSNWIIDNNGTIETTADQVRSFWHETTKSTYGA